MAAFVDTNIFIYAFVANTSNDPRKVSAAQFLLADLMKRRDLVVSAQVLNEFASNAIRKGSPPLSLQSISQIVDMIAMYPVVPIDATLVQLALTRVQLSRISYWDALILEAALRSGADTLYTEDMHHGTRYGSLEVRNPFL
jgi:predicted nucleic acid-binding protein